MKKNKIILTLTLLLSVFVFLVPFLICGVRR